MLPGSSARIPEHSLVSKADLIETYKEYPYMKHVDCSKLTPAHFGLEKWCRQFVIPDHWMRKIYSDEVWKDSDLPEPVREELTREQKIILHTWLAHDSPFKDELPPGTATRKPRYKPQRSDDLQELLDMPKREVSEDTCDTTELLNDSEDRSSNHDLERRKIPICYGHRIQPEEAISQKAVENMRRLSEKEKESLAELLADDEYMTLLNRTIETYLKQQELCPC